MLRPLNMILSIMKAQILLQCKRRFAQWNEKETPREKPKIYRKLKKEFDNDCHESIVDIYFDLGEANGKDLGKKKEFIKVAQGMKTNPVPLKSFVPQDSDHTG